MRQETKWKSDTSSPGRTNFTFVSDLRTTHPRQRCVNFTLQPRNLDCWSVFNALLLAITLRMAAASSGASSGRPSGRSGESLLPNHQRVISQGKSPGPSPTAASARSAGASRMAPAHFHAEQSSVKKSAAPNAALQVTNAQRRNSPADFWAQRTAAAAARQEDDDEEPSLLAPVGGKFPFHEGERLMQSEALSRAEVNQMDSFAVDFIRTSMPRQHQAFYAQLDMLYVGYQDGDGHPAGTVMAGRRGFISSPDASHLRIDLSLVDSHLRLQPQVGQQLGMLGLMLHNRRRNRVNGVVVESDRDSFLLRVNQSFGNCPKYISTREVVVSEKGLTGPRPEVTATSGHGPLQSAQALQIRQADTFFITSSYGGQRTERLLVGADMSHRGGNPGFVQVDNQGLTVAWPDYQGNNMFQTLGNLMTNPAAGLLFLDYETGDMLQVQGVAQVEADKDLPGAQRTVRLSVERWQHTSKAVPIEAHAYLEASPYSPALPTRTGSSPRAGEDLEVLDVRQEAEGVLTFTMAAPAEGSASGHQLQAGMHAVFAFQPETLSPTGQHRSPRGPTENRALQRSWTVSSFHEDGRLPPGSSFTVSVKLEPGGLVSSYMHRSVSPGASLSFLGFGGDFTLASRAPALLEPSEAADTAESAAPVVLLAGGIGITPLRPILSQLRREQPGRRVVLLYSVRRLEEGAFLPELQATAQESNGLVRMIVTATGPEAKDRLQHHRPSSLADAGTFGRPDVADAAVVWLRGRLTAEALLAAVPGIGRASVFMCGPESFMRQMEQELDRAGASMGCVHTESFAY